MKWQDDLLHADVEMSNIARQKGKARLTVNYYGDRHGVVRKVLEMGGLETSETYDKGVDED